MPRERSTTSADVAEQRRGRDGVSQFASKLMLDDNACQYQ